MEIFYCCKTGVHASILAASLHLGLLAGDRCPEYSEIGRLSFFDPRKRPLPGNPLCLGKDEVGNQVYIMGLSRENQLIKNAINGLMEVFAKQDAYLLIDASAISNAITRLGQHIPGELGYRIFLLGMKREFKQVLDLVETAKNGPLRPPQLDLCHNLVDNMRSNT